MGGLKACIIGSGNWGSAIARIVGSTVQKHAKFDKTVNMWVFEEMVDGKKLSEIINTTHENVKYLPGKILPSNVVAVPDVVESAKDADILIFVVPHQFVKGICEQLLGKIKSNVIGVSLIKGLASHQSGGIKLVSEVIREMLHIDVAVLMGANLAHEVASDNFCEATVGCTNKSAMGQVLKDLFHTDNFRINVVEDA
uniref:Glycerol-3-phosphate dehydrogenase NAD-dependent N-terminal domain-containing protein n=1 Tax=Plectus sambesii TaxID=2011161 RepID=A0A914UPL7_9BILA